MQEAANDPQTKDLTAEGVRWDLSDLCTLEKLDEELENLKEMSEGFRSEYAEFSFSENGDEIVNMMSSYLQIKDAASRLGAFAHLHWAEDTTDEERGRILSKVQSYLREAGKRMMFFEDKWTELEREEMRRVLVHLEEEGYGKLLRHHLEVMYVEASYLLGEEVEKAIAAKSRAASSAWDRFFDETVASTSVEWHDEESGMVDDKPITSLLTYLKSGDRTKRRQAKDKVSEGLREILRVQTYVLNTVMADSHEEDKLRGKGRPEDWCFFRHLDNEVEDHVVTGMVEDVESSFGTCHRHYANKARAMGHTLEDYDRSAPLGLTEPRKFSWEEARDLVIDTYDGFGTEFGEIAEMFFFRGWIDAEERPGKEGGAFSHPGSPSTHPYVLMNFNGNVGDVYTLAHELGHGIHQYLARDVGPLHQSTPLTIAETASVFGEMLVFDRILASCETETEELEVLSKKLDSIMATVHRQVGMFLFEDDVHQTFRREGELSSGYICDRWLSRQRMVYGPDVKLSSEYGMWWAYVPHFIHAPGYVYSYAFGQLLVLSLWERYTQMRDRGEGGQFAWEFQDMLSKGSSLYPREVVATAGEDFEEQGFWGNGTRYIERMVDREAELVEKLGY